MTTNYESNKLFSLYLLPKKKTDKIENADIENYSLKLRDDDTALKLMNFYHALTTQFCCQILFFKILIF